MHYMFLHETLGQNERPSLILANDDIKLKRMPSRFKWAGTESVSKGRCYRDVKDLIYLEQHKLLTESFTQAVM